MQQYNDDELIQLLQDGESDLVERKESLRGDAPTLIREAICAFANDLPNHQRAGVIFIGVKDDGTASQLPITDELLLQLADMKTDGSIVPPPTFAITKRHLHGHDVAIITVEPADSPPVRYRGRICIRIGPRRGIASAQDERILNEKRRYRDRPFDIQPVNSALLSDLDQWRFQERYLPSAFAPDILEANERSLEQRLAASKMIGSFNEPTPTVLGILVLCHRSRDFLPGAYIQFLRIDGTDLSDPIVDELLIEGTIDTVLNRIDEKCIAHNRVAVDFTSGTVETRTYTYPLIALQQLIRNAVLHRTYETSYAPVRVTWFNDRIEILNPGGAYGAITPENFGVPGLTDYRNPNLAEALRVLGYSQRFGVGIPTARRELHKNGNPPVEFLVQASSVRAVVRIATAMYVVG